MQDRSAAKRQEFRRLWIALLEAKVRRLSRKQDRLSRQRTDCIVLATKHRRKLNA